MIRYVVLTMVVLAGANVARASELTDAQSVAVRDAETQGRALYAAAAKTDTAVDNDDLVKKARARISDFCSQLLAVRSWTRPSLPCHLIPSWRSVRVRGVGPG